MARPKKDNAEYFTHDANMRNDVKIKALRRKFSHTGYAIWCFLLETLTNEEGFEIEFSELNLELLAADYDVSVEELKAIIDYACYIDLLQISDDGKFLFSEVHKNRFYELLGRRERRSEAGKRGMEARWNENNTTAGEDNINEINDNNVITKDEFFDKNDNNVIKTENFDKNDKNFATKTENFDKINDNENDNNVITKGEFFGKNDNNVITKGEKDSNFDNTEITNPEKPITKNNKVKESKVNILYPYRDIVETWNSVCVDLPKIQKLNDVRRKKIKLRLDEFGVEPEKFLDSARDLFERVQNSDFLTGRRGGGGWTATFDWLFDNSKNWLKVVEGNYDNDRGGGGHGTVFSGRGFGGGERTAPSQRLTSVVRGDGKRIRLGVDEYINEEGQRTYGSGRVIIPDDARPRPSERYYWDAIAQDWLL